MSFTLMNLEFEVMLLPIYARK